MNTLKTIALTSAALLVFSRVLIAAEAETLELPEVGGYDLVSYHQEGGPAKGNSGNAVRYQGMTYYFASEANQAAFEADPDTYLPAYGGFCSHGLCFGSKIEGDPTVYEIIDGKLYLYSDRELRRMWLEDQTANIELADANWAELE